MKSGASRRRAERRRHAAPGERPDDRGRGQEGVEHQDLRRRRVGRPGCRGRPASFFGPSASGGRLGRFLSRYVRYRLLRAHRHRGRRADRDRARAAAEGGTHARPPLRPAATLRERRQGRHPARDGARRAEEAALAVRGRRAIGRAVGGRSRQAGPRGRRRSEQIDCRFDPRRRCRHGDPAPNRARCPRQPPSRPRNQPRRAEAKV